MTMARTTFTFEGKRYDVTAEGDKKLAAKVALKKRNLEEGRVIISQNTIVKKWIKEWLNTYKKTAVSAVTYIGYESRINAHITLAIGSMKIKDVKPLHLQKILNGLNGYSKEYISKVEYTLD